MRRDAPKTGLQLRLQGRSSKCRATILRGTAIRTTPTAEEEGDGKEDEEEEDWNERHGPGKLKDGQVK